MTDQPSPRPAADHCLDATGLVCPEPLMVVRNRMRNLSAGEVLAVRATDPSTQRDIPQYCRFVHHDLLLAEEDDGEYHYLIRKGAGR